MLRIRPDLHLSQRFPNLRSGPKRGRQPLFMGSPIGRMECITILARGFIITYNIIFMCLPFLKKHRTTTSAIMEIVEKITDTVENNQFSVGIYIDVQKAFKTLIITIDLHILLRKIG